MGSAVAANLALFRPDIFQRLVIMSAPFTGAPSPPGHTNPAAKARASTIHELSRINPPRKHYQLYFCDEQANKDWLERKQGLEKLYRGYYYFKSGLYPQTEPKSLGTSWTAEKMSLLPEYYIMRHDRSMSETVAKHVPDLETMEAEMTRMTKEELHVYVAEFKRTGFQGGLNHYRARVSGHDSKLLSVSIGKQIEVPFTFISGARDWGNYQDPCGLERMQSSQVAQEGRFKGVTLVPETGHWVCALWQILKEYI